MQHKMINDAVAYIRSLAQLRGRNADWAEEALKKNVIDLIAVDVPELLRKLDGRTLTVLGTSHTINTRDLAAANDLVRLMAPVRGSPAAKPVVVTPVICAGSKSIIQPLSPKLTVAAHAMLP
ncbi:MAG: hypothetical protein ACYDC8_15415 [Gammaproteobacteria bacterium]